MLEKHTGKGKKVYFISIYAENSGKQDRLFSNHNANFYTISSFFFSLSAGNSIFLCIKALIAYEQSLQ